jgi:hypothetical protein
VTRNRIFLLAVALLGACTSNPPAEEPEQTVEVLEDIVLTVRARIPENDPAFERVEVYGDRLVFHFSAPPEQGIGPVDTPAGTYNAIVAGAHGGGYLREVLSVREVSANVLEATTGRAELTDLIASGHFRVHHNPRGSSFVEGDGVTAAVAPLEGEGSVNLLPPGLSEACSATAGGGIEVNPTIDMDVDFDIDIDIDVDVDWGWTGPSISGELESATFVMSGALELGAEVTTSTNGTVSCEVDLIEFAEGRGINVPSREWTTTFAVGPVPVVLTHEIGPTASISISGSVETGTATATSSVVYSIRAGAEYRDGSWREVWEPRRTSSGSFEVGMPGTVTITAELSGGVEYNCKIYDLLGPKVGLEGSLTGEFSSDLCEWEGEVSAGISIVGGGEITVPVIDHTLAEFEVSQELAKVTLWEDDGTWPWCEDGGIDAGMPGDGGTMPGDDGGTGVDGGDNPCESATDCAACNEIEVCGWCEGSGCMHDSQETSCGGTWRDSPSECVDCNALYGSDCETCRFAGECGWCGATGTCETAGSMGARPSNCSGDWHYNYVTDDSVCGG